jgi:hypothetical protein
MWGGNPELKRHPVVRRRATLWKYSKWNSFVASGSGCKI